MSCPGDRYQHRNRREISSMVHKQPFLSLLHSYKVLTGTLLTHGKIRETTARKSSVYLSLIISTNFMNMPHKPCHTVRSPLQNIYLSAIVRFCVSHKCIMFISTAAINKLQTIPQLVMKFETSHSPDIASKKKKNTNPVQYLQLAHLHSPPRKTSHAENRKKRSVRPLTPRYGNASNKDYQLTYTQNEGLHNLVLVGHVGDHVGHIIF